MSEEKAPYIYAPLRCVHCGDVIAYEAELNGVPYLRYERSEIVGHAAIRCAVCGKVTVWNGGSDTPKTHQEAPGEA